MSDLPSKNETVLMYSCSGCADLGEVADRATRILNRNGFAKMTCLAGVGAGLSGFVESAKGADRVIAVDGCPVACAQTSLKKAGAKTITSHIITAMGYVKGETNVTDSVVNDVVNKITSSKESATQSASTGCSCGGSCS